MYVLHRSIHVHVQVQVKQLYTLEKICDRNISDIYCKHTPVNTGGLFEEGGVPAQVNYIIVLTKVFPCDPKNTWR